MENKSNTVFIVSVVISVIIAAWGILGSESFGNVANALMQWVTVNTGWLYLLSMLVFVIFALVLAFSRYGNIKLGPDDSKPEFKTISWFGMLFGAGMGTMQINSGLSYLFKLPNNVTSWFIIILIITVIYTWTAVSGIDKGINFISNLNLILAFSCIVIAVIVGPKVMMANTFTGITGDYINQFFKDSLSIDPFGSNKWLQGWRIFYWAWWIAWAPFVGTFIARISKGRTVREFIFGVILAPALASLIWFSVFGSMGLNLRHALGTAKLTEMAGHPEIALFEVFSRYPLGIILSILTIILLCTFFITSANSATFVLSMFSQNGDLNPSKKKMLIWGVLQAVIAFALMISGGLKALQTASIAAAFPFIFIMLAICLSILKAFKSEKKTKN